MPACDIVHDKVLILQREKTEVGGVLDLSEPWSTCQRMDINWRIDKDSRIEQHLLNIGLDPNGQLVTYRYLDRLSFVHFKKPI